MPVLDIVSNFLDLLHRHRRTSEPIELMIVIIDFPGRLLAAACQTVRVREIVSRLMQLLRSPSEVPA